MRSKKQIYKKYKRSKKRLKYLKKRGGSYENQPATCTATAATTGERCRNIPKEGLKRCHLHINTVKYKNAGPLAMVTHF